MMAHSISRREAKMRQAYAEKQCAQSAQQSSSRQDVQYGWSDSNTTSRNDILQREIEQYKYIMNELHTRAASQNKELLVERTKVTNLENDLKLLLETSMADLASKHEENRKLKEKIAKLEDHIKGLEEAFKLIGNGQAA